MGGLTGCLMFPLKGWRGRGRRARRMLLSGLRRAVRLLLGRQYMTVGSGRIGRSMSGSRKERALQVQHGPSRRVRDAESSVDFLQLQSSIVLTYSISVGLAHNPFIDLPS